MQVSSKDGDNETLGHTKTQPADIDDDSNTTVIGLLKKILILLEMALSEKP